MSDGIIGLCYLPESVIFRLDNVQIHENVPSVKVGLGVVWLENIIG